MLIPASATTLSGSSVTFTWSAASGAAAYWLDVGSVQGQGNIFGQNLALATSHTVSTLPTDGSTVYVKLWTLAGNVWRFNDYTFKAAGGNAKAAIVGPVPGSSLSGSTVTFTWSAASGAAAYWLDVGSAQGQGNIFGQNLALTTSHIVTGVPVDGSTIYVKLWTLSGNAWLSNDYTFKASAGVQGAMTAPVPSSTLSGSTVTFTWSAASGATAYWLDIGSTGAGASDRFSQGTVATSQIVTGLPTGGSTIFVRLWAAINGIWQFKDYTYKAAP
jgi:hypothetical protein